MSKLVFKLLQPFLDGDDFTLVVVDICLSFTTRLQAYLHLFIINPNAYVRDWVSCSQFDLELPIPLIVS